MIRKNMKLIVGIVMGLIVSGFGVYAANSLSAASISIDKSKMSKVENSNLQSALDYLYGQSEKTNMITVESGILHKSQTYLGIAYLDPTNLDNKCTSENSTSNIEQKTGCMKWYIYKDLGDSYKMILDHNIKERQTWNTATNVTNKGTNVAFAENTTGDSSHDNNVYKEVKLLSTSVANGGSGWVVEPDIISAEEVAEIVGYNGFINTDPNTWFYFDSKNNQTQLYGQGTSNYAWLFDNLGWTESNCTSYGCNYSNTNNSEGYWTRTPEGEAGKDSRVWVVFGGGNLDRSNAYYTRDGVRPVITISKSSFIN